MKYRKLKILYLLILTIPFMVPNLLATEENITHANVTLYPPSSYNVSWTEYIGNHTTHHYWPVYCMLNVTDQDNPRCELDRTLNHGETYIKDDEFCDVNLRCPEAASCDDVQNTTHAVNYRTEIDENGTVCVTVLQTNETRCEQMGQTRAWETEYKFDCPTIEGWEDDIKDRLKDWSPVNITEQQWYWLCLEPFGEYGKALSDLTDKTTGFQQKLIEDLAATRESNKALAEENGNMKAKIEGYEECKNQRLECTGNLEDCRASLSDCELERGAAETGVEKTWFWPLLIFNFVFFVIIGLRKRWRRAFQLEYENYEARY